VRLSELVHKYNAGSGYYADGCKGPSPPLTIAGYAAGDSGDRLMSILVRLALLGLSLATITPVARGATLDAPHAASMPMATTR
jgi:hypothetical protein